MNTSNRWKNITRGSAWRKEPPEKYGINKCSLGLPWWLFEALGINNSYYQPFAIFKEGDWFDGVNEGTGEVDAIHLLLNHLPNNDAPALFIYRKNIQRWHVYQSSERQICAWLELRKWPVKPAANQVLSFKGNAADKKKKLAFYLKNTVG